MGDPLRIKRWSFPTVGLDGRPQPRHRTSDHAGMARYPQAYPCQLVNCGRSRPPTTNPSWVYARPGFADRIRLERATEAACWLTATNGKQDQTGRGGLEEWQMCPSPDFVLRCGQCQDVDRRSLTHPRAAGPPLIDREAALTMRNTTKARSAQPPWHRPKGCPIADYLWSPGHSRK